MTYSNTQRTVWTDISYYQQVVNDTYPEPMFSFRADTGYSTDSNAAANWRWCQRTDRIVVALAYVVLVPGAEQSIANRLRNLFGDEPPPKLAVMIDMESGRGFAGSGNHSASGNHLAELLATWLGDRRRVVAYANRYDYDQNWPQMVDWLRPRRVTASYGSSDPGTWGHQYHGGSDYPVPSGLPRSMPPFGSNVDLNVTHRSVTQVAVDLGLHSPQPLTLLEWIMTLPGAPKGLTYDQHLANQAKANTEHLLHRRLKIAGGRPVYRLLVRLAPKAGK